MSDCHAGASVAPGLLSRPHQTRPLRAVLIGPPNSGKSTLFNALTGLRQKVANYPGVTVEQRSGLHRCGDIDVELIDLPGIYSLDPASEDEWITHDILQGSRPDLPRPDAILLILDGTRLNRHLTLAAPILALKLPTLVLINMSDELQQRGGDLDPQALSRKLGVPVALISARRGQGLEAIDRFFSQLQAQNMPPPRPVELPVLQDLPQCRSWAVRMGCAAEYRAPAPSLWTRRLDAILLHRLGGPLIFALVVLAVFQAIFTGARPLMDAMEDLIARSGEAIRSALPPGILQSLLIDGVWSGIGSVVVFLPQILLLFLFIGILEDSGYLARAAVIADRTMRRVGLQGKSFIPLISGYACAVPAILATRTIERKRDRIATILIVPLMTCSARLPVYTLIIAAFIPERPLLGPLLGARAAALLSLYVLGFLAAWGTAFLLKSSILKSEPTPFSIELPPYRWPSFRGLLLRLYDRAKIFLRRAGTIIFLVALILWVLSSFPLNEGRRPPIEQSLVGRLGKTIEPLIQPLGFNWKIGIGLITSLAAREVIIGTLGAIYGLEGQSDSGELQAALRRELSPGAAAALLIFFAFALQCMSTLAVVRRETGSWKWPLAQFSYMFVLAYSAAWLAKSLVDALA
jgi:ferrous iron transport protein B